MNKLIAFLLISFMQICFLSCTNMHYKKAILEGHNISKESNKCEYEEIDGEKYEPLNQSLENPRLEQPYDLAVSNDGNTVYVTDYKYDADNRCLGAKSEKDWKIAEKNLIHARKFIYKITKDGKISILKINNIPPFNTNNFLNIEKDENDDLYITNPDTFGIYRISEKNNYLKKIIEFKERSSRSIFSNYTSPIDKKKLIMASYLSGPYNILTNKNEIYFSLSDFDEQDSGHFLRRLNLSDNKVNQLMEKTLDSFDNFLYALYKDKIYLYFRENDEYKTNIGIYEVNKEIKLSNENFKEITKFIGFIEGSKGITIDIQDMRFNSKGELFIVDSERNVIWKMLPEDKKLIRFAGNGKEGFKDGPGNQAEFNSPKYIDFDKYNDLYLTDNGNNAIRKISPEGIVSTFYVGK